MNYHKRPLLYWSRLSLLLSTKCSFLFPLHLLSEEGSLEKKVRSNLGKYFLCTSKCSEDKPVTLPLILPNSLQPKLGVQSSLSKWEIWTFMSAYKPSLIFSNFKSNSEAVFMNWPPFRFLILFLPVSSNVRHTPGTLTYHSPQEDKLFATVYGVIRPGCESWLLQMVTQVTRPWASHVTFLRLSFLMANEDNDMNLTGLNQLTCSAGAQ